MKLIRQSHCYRALERYMRLDSKATINPHFDFSSGVMSGRVNLKVHMLNDATTPTGEPCLLHDWSSHPQLMH